MTLPTSPDVAAAVLIGGRSRRMGEPKALLRLSDGGPTLLERVVLQVEQCTRQTLLVGTPDVPVPSGLLALPRLEDCGQGPVGGLVSALRGCQHDGLLLTGCDMPFLSRRLLGELIERSASSDYGLCPVSLDEEGRKRLQPLLAIYRRETLAPIESLYWNGARSLHAVVHALGMEQVPVDELEHLDPGLWSFFNVNTPVDLEIARHHERELRGNGSGILGGNRRNERR